MAITQVKFVQLSQSTYDDMTIEEKLSTQIFFTTDTLRIYKGNTLYSQNVSVLTSQEVENYLQQNDSENGCSAFVQHLYIDKQNGSMYICDVDANVGVNKFVQVGISNELKGRLAYLTQLSDADANKIVTVNANGTAFIYNKTIVSVIGDVDSATNDNVASEKSVRDIIGNGATAKTPLLVNSKLNKQFNPIAIASIEDSTGSDDFSKVKFIGDCKVTYGADGQIVIRIGQNLNSSTFNNTDGKTIGTATKTHQGTQSATLTGQSSPKTVWLAGEKNEVIVTTTGKIHFDDNTSNLFKLTISGKDSTGAVSKEFTFGPITGDSSTDSPYTDATLTGASLAVTNFVQEKNTPEGATGYEGNVSFTVDVKALEFVDGYVSLKIQQTGTAQAKVYTANKMFWFITDTTTKASVSNVKAKWSSEPSKYTESGITTIKSGTVQYSATLENISTPASENASNSYVQFTNDKNFAPDLSNQAADVDATTISKDASILDNNKVTIKLYSGFYADTTDCLSVSASNINGSTGVAKGSLYAEDGTTVMSKLDIYIGSTDSSIAETNRRTDTGATWDSTAVLGAKDLQVYHGYIQYPANTNFSGANNANANRDYTALQSGEKYIILYYSAAGTQKGGKITLTGSNLNATDVTGVVLGNSLTNLKDITSLSGIGTNPVFSSDGKSATFPYTFKTEADNITSATGCYVKISFKEKSAAKISKVTRG